MTKVSLHAQASAVDVALSAFRSRSLPKLRQGELEMQERNLRAAKRTMLALQVWRDRLPEEFVAECEEGEPPHG